MEILLSITLFLKVFILFMSILKVLKETFRLYKSVKLKKEHDIDSLNSILLAMSISFILTLIFI